MKQAQTDERYPQVITQILKAVAVGMSAASIVLQVLNVATAELGVTLLGIGLFALALVSLRKGS